MLNQPKVLKERKQSLNKGNTQDFVYTFNNLQPNNSAVKQKQNAVTGRVRSSSSLPKYHAGITDCLWKETAYTLQGNQKSGEKSGKWLIGWGQGTGDLSSSIKSIKSANNVIKFSAGEKHIVYITNRHEAFGIGNSILGQLGYYQSIESSLAEPQIFSAEPVPIMEELLIQDIFCTPFCTFFLTNRQQIYACGMNNRGQLGISIEQNASDSMHSVSNPIKIHTLSKKSLIFGENSFNQSNLMQSAKKSKSGKIQSYALAEKNLNIGLTTQQSKLLTQKSQGSEIYIHTQGLTTQFSQQTQCQADHHQDSILNDGECIASITGGPFHTIAMSNFGRVFYSGSIYKKSAVLNDQFTTNFAQLNLKKIGKVQKIRSGLTSIGLLNCQGNLFILGALTDSIVCDEPYNVGINSIVDFGFGKDKIYVVTCSGQIWALVAYKKNLRSCKLMLKQKDRGAKIVQVQSGIDFCMFVDERGQIFGQGNYKLMSGSEVNENQKLDLGHKKSSSSLQICEGRIEKLEIEKNSLSNIKVSTNFVLGLSNVSVKYEKFKQPANNNLKNQDNQNLLKRINQLQKQNKLLKDLIKQDNQQNKPKNGISSARKKDLTSSSNLTNIQMVKKSSVQESSNKFDMNLNISQKVITKARKFDSSMEIPFSELQLGKQISEGGYGIIYKAVWRKTTVAVKIFKIDINSENSIKDFVSQCYAMEVLRHPNIVMFLGACTKPPNFAIVLQYCEGGTLWSILQKSGELNWEQRRKLALDTARGMNYLHERPTPILHRDLKSLNLLLDENKRVKLADFGWTKGLQNYMTGKIGTYQWMAPEVVSSHQYTQKADVFSFAIIMWEIASRQAPYRNIPGAQVAQDVLHKDLRPTIPKKSPQAFVALMKRCWAKNPEARPNFVEIIEKLENMQLPEGAFN